MSELDVLSFGEALVDFFPDRPGVPLAECDVFHRHLGGAPCNVAVALARAGARVGLMTLVGPDDFGTFVKRRLAEEGVDVRGVGVHRTAKTGVTFVSVKKDGGRGFLFFRHPSADMMITEHDVDAALIAGARVLHVGSSTLSREPSRAATLRAVEAAKAAGCLVSSDPNWRPHLWEDPREATPLITTLLAGCDIIKISDDELGPICGTSQVEDAARMLRERGAGLVVITLGARGCYFQARGGSGHVPGERVCVVDTTGAGDAFMAGLLAALAPRFAGGAKPDDLDAEELHHACARGNALGARAVTQMGATAGLPRRF
jgi:fructokinase